MAKVYIGILMIPWKFRQGKVRRRKIGANPKPDGAAKRRNCTGLESERDACHTPSRHNSDKTCPKAMFTWNNEGLTFIGMGLMLSELVNYDYVYNMQRRNCDNLHYRVRQGYPTGNGIDVISLLPSILFLYYRSPSYSDRLKGGPQVA